LLVFFLPLSLFFVCWNIDTNIKLIVNFYHQIWNLHSQRFGKTATFSWKWLVRMAHLVTKVRSTSWSQKRENLSPSVTS
jgi:hypothetical protein